MKVDLLEVAKVRFSECERTGAKELVLNPILMRGSVDRVRLCGLELHRLVEMAVHGDT